MTTLTSGWACTADWTAGWIFVAHSVTPTLISCTILQFGQCAASSLLKSGDERLGRRNFVRDDQHDIGLPVCDHGRPVREDRADLAEADRQ